MSRPASDGESAQPKFFLTPYNDEVEEAISAFLEDHRNSNYVHYNTRFKRNVLCVDFSQKSRVTLGTSRCDITLPGIARQQCHFTLHKTTSAVVLTDDSRERTTEVSDEERAVPLTERARSVVVSRGINRLLRIGPLWFYLVWPSVGDHLHTFLGQHPSSLGPKNEVDPSKYRYLAGEMLGNGASGWVCKAVNIRTGKAMAVKQLLSLNTTRYDYAQREIQTMRELSENTSDLESKHILPIHDSVAAEDTTWIEIFLPLKEGSVLNLLYPYCVLPKEDIAQMVLNQMARALKFLERKGLIHRDVKPENILYETRYDSDGTPHYHFLLADFGLARHVLFAQTAGVGTELYMAPEASCEDTQTCKMDIWSLFVTVVWISDTDGFRNYHGRNGSEKVVELSQRDEYAQIRDMAEIDYEARVSASQLVSRLEGRAPWPAARRERSGRSGRGDRRRGSRHEDAGPDEFTEPGPSNYTHAAGGPFAYGAAMAGYSALPGVEGFDAALYSMPPDTYNAEANLRGNYFPRNAQDNAVDDEIYDLD